MKSNLAFLAIGLAWIGLRVAFWNGYYTEDAPGYVTDAIYAALGNYHARDYVNGLNVGTYLPVALPIRFLGKSEIALGLWPLLCSLLGLVSLTASSAVLFGRGFGLLAALLYATYPGDVFFSTVVMPDAIQAGWLSCSVLLIVLAYVGSAHQRSWKLAGAGLALGVCHLIRGNDVVLVPIGLCGVVTFSRLWKRDAFAVAARGCVCYLSGWALIHALEGLVYLWTVNDFLHRFRVVNRHYGTLGSIRQWGLNADPSTIPFSIFAPVMWWRMGGWGQFNQDQAYHALVFCLALTAVLAGFVVLRRSKVDIPDRAIAGFAMGALWLSWPLLYHQFGSQSLTQFVPIHRLSRHLVVYAPGAVFATVAGCFLLKEAACQSRSPVGRRIAIAMACVILLVHLFFNWRGEQVAYDAYQRIKGTYERIRGRLPREVQNIVADPGDLCFFDFWLNPLGAETVKMTPFASYSRCEDLPDGVVLTYSNPGWIGLGAPVIQETVKRLPCLLQPPAHWRLLYEGYPERVFIVEASRRTAR